MALNVAGKVAYGAVFVVLLPAALAAWARAAGPAVRLPAVTSPPLGLAAAAAGAALLIWGMANLWSYGGGLPMNAYPPPRHVSRGVYSLLPHPIYTGFTILCAGVSIAAGSASGLWLVTPVVALSSAALVLGYERHDLAARFGAAPLGLLPPADQEAPTFRDRLACYLFVLLPWLAGYEAVIALGTPPGAVSGALPFEQRLPVLEWTEYIYASTYLAAVLAPLAAATRASLRTFAVHGLAAMAVAFPLHLTVPLTAPPRPFEPETAAGRLLGWERSFDSEMAAFPSFHVIWAVLAAELCARRWPRLRWWFRLWAWLVAASCVTTGQHPLVDVLGGFATVWLVARIGSLYQALCGLTERIANSWREWRLGPLRVINHGVYAGAGGFLAVWLAASTAGEASHAALLLAVFATALGAALWAQLVEGSPLLLRPFGFYGGLLGGMAGALAAPLAGSSTWLVLAVCALGGPWAQALGRLRCLVQGCCHGRPAPAGLGIRYLHPRSRVCRLSAWAGVPLHPTPLYSLLWNGFTALVVTRLWTLDAPLHLVAGVYLMLNGLGRFVEEAWRGEPQTPVFLRLRLYQWAALASLLAGALMTALGDSPAAPALRLSTAGLAPAAVFGLAVTAAMGVDFPGSNRRYSRLV